MNPRSSANNSCQALCQSVGQGSLTITFTRIRNRLLRVGAGTGTGSLAATVMTTGATGVVE